MENKGEEGWCVFGLKVAKAQKKNYTVQVKYKKSIILRTKQYPDFGFLEF